MQQTFSKIMNQFDRLDEIAAASEVKLDRRVESVSRWSVTQQLDHIGSTDLYISDRIDEAMVDSAINADRRPKFIGRIMLATGFIPRGKGQAPEAVLPAEPSPEELREHLKSARERLGGFESRLSEIKQSAGRTPHPLLGFFTAANWLTFIDIHHHHHLKIIRDIEKHS